MGFFKKIFPKPKDVLKSPKTLITSSPRDKIKDFLASPKALISGDIGGALNYAARPGGSLVDRNNAAMDRATALRRANAADAQFAFYSQRPMMAGPPQGPITPPSYGGLNDYMSRPAPPIGAPGGYAPPPVPAPAMQRPYGMFDDYVSRINGGLAAQPMPYGGPPAVQFRRF